MLIFLIKYWKQIALFLLISFLLLLVSVKTSEIKSLKSSHALYVKEQQAKQDKAKIEAQNKLIEAEREYSAKLIKISADADVASNRANSLSKQLSEANKRLSTATKQVSDEYTKQLSNVFTSCITEYRNMAKVADENKADAGRNK